MSLAEKLDATRAASAGRVPPERRAIMHRATEDLRNSGILDRIVPVGQPARASNWPTMTAGASPPTTCWRAVP